jgi:amidase
MTRPAGGAPIVGAEHEVFAFDRMIPPALEVDPGTTVAFRTSGEILRRLAAGAAPDSLDLERANAVTGPVLIRGAEPGDALRVEILDIAIDRAWFVRVEGLGPLGALTEGIRVVEAPLADGRIRIGERLSVPAAPMIGCIGLAPAEGTGSTMRPVAPTGGNLDLRELCPGAVLWLPVAVPGALLSLGDLHAAMGHGEPAFVAVEAAGTATVRVEVEKDAGLALPRARSGGDTICIGMGATHPEARASAVRQAHELLVRAHGLSPDEAYAYLCARVDLRPAGPSGSIGEGLEAVLAAVPDPPPDGDRHHP